MIKAFVCAFLLLAACLANPHETDAIPRGVAGTVVVSTCPQGTAYVSVGDGCQNAPGCTSGTVYCFRAANFFSGYTGVSYSTRPPWNEPGIDYAVGIHNACITSGLKDPSTSPPTGTSYSGNTLTVTGANVTINCYDFSLHNGIDVVCTTGTGTLTLTDSYFLYGSAQSGNGTGIGLTTNGGCSANPVIKYNSFNDTIGSASGYTSYVYFAGTGNPITEYNVFLHSAKDFIHDVHSTAVTTTVTNLYNYGEDMEGHGGAHVQPYLSYGGPTTGDQESWNVFYATSNTHNGFALCTSNNDFTGGNQANFSCNYNVLVSALTGGTQSIAGLFAVYPNETGTFTGSHNYLDYTGSFYPWYPDQGIAGLTTVSTGNVHLTNGATCNAYSSSC